MPQLNDTKIRKLPVPASGYKITRDTKVHGLGVRITANGFRSFVLGYSVAGRERRMTIGEFDDWTIEQARAEARRLKRLIDQGIDPLEKRIAEREAPTVRDLAKRFLEEHAPRNKASYLAHNEMMLRKWILPKLGGMKVAAVGPNHIEEVHRAATKAGSPVAANRAIACLSKMFSLAIRWQYRQDNPCKHAVDRNTEEPRRRYLKTEEIARLGVALKSHPSQQAADVIRLLMLTGCRRGEALSARAEQIDLGEKIWRKPSASTKQGKPHEAPLPAPAIELLARLVGEAEKAGRTYLFPSRDGKGHMTDLKRAWATLCQAAGLADVHLHDLRHSYAAIAASGGATLPLIGALLGHSNPATTNRYSHIHNDPQRAVAERVAAVIVGNDDASAEIVSIGRKRS